MHQQYDWKEPIQNGWIKNPHKIYQREIDSKAQCQRWHLLKFLLPYSQYKKNTLRLMSMKFQASSRKSKPINSALETRRSEYIWVVLSIFSRKQYWKDRLQVPFEGLTHQFDCFIPWYCIHDQDECHLESQCCKYLVRANWKHLQFLYLRSSWWDEGRNRIQDKGCEYLSKAEWNNAIYLC